MRAIISAGGTGGHIYPAIAILNKIKNMDSDSEILYIGTRDRMEAKLIPEMNIKYVGIDMEGLNRKNIIKNVVVLTKYLFAYQKAKKVIKEFNPDIVIGVGGYITAPVIKAAHSLKIKTIIHEQNSYPGLTNKSLSKIVNKILVSLPDSVKYFPEGKTVYTGNPRSEQIINERPIMKSELGLSDNKNLVVIVMGSLGSKTINDKLKNMVNNFKDKPYEVLIITGKDYYDEYKEIITPNNVLIKPFINNLINVLKIADIIVSRAGASTISEITAIGLPAILVPSPYVTNNHQLKNAQSLEEKGACKIIEEKDFTSDNLINMIDTLFSNAQILRDMSIKSKTLCIPDSATRIYSEISNLVRND